MASFQLSPVNTALANSPNNAVAVEVSDVLESVAMLYNAMVSEIVNFMTSFRKTAVEGK